MSKIIVTTPTGNIGRRVAQHLVDAGADITLIARDPAKVESLVSAGAKVESGSLDDAAFLTRAFDGAESLFWLTPPNYATEDFIAHQRRCGEAAAAAIRATQVARVVNLSSMGAQNGKGMGPVNGLHDVEKILEEATENITHLRPGFFFENFLEHVETIKAMGGVFMPLGQSTRMPMVATADIGRVAANRLIETGWTGRSVRAIHGPADLSLNEAAEALSEGLGRPVNYMTVVSRQAREVMLTMGLTEGTVGLILEMYASLDSGAMSSAEPRTPETTTPTTLATFAREVMAGLL